MTAMKILIVVLALVVAGILGMGLRNMMQRGDVNASQKLMRLRIGVQFIVIALVMVTLYVYQ